MKRFLRIIAVVLLVFLGIGGIYGAWMLISDPSGGKFDWPPELLDGTPFSSYLIPGIILMISIGIFPLYVAIITIIRKSYSHLLIILQGVVLIGWLTIELIINQAFFVPGMHYTCYAIGILLVFIGARGFGLKF